jgi:hypothetical protein
MVTRWEAIRTAARRARERLAQRLGQPLAALPACINSRWNGAA